MKQIFFPFFYLLISVCSAQQAPFTIRNEVETRIKKYIDPKNQLTGFYDLNEKGISIYAGQREKAAGKKEFFLSWSDVIDYRNCIKFIPGDSLLTAYKKGLACKGSPLSDNRRYDPKMPLTGVKIALDPGHVAGNTQMASLEYKTLQLKKNPEKGLEQDIELIEGNLTLATALILKDSLEKLGATVLITRDQQNETSYGTDYYEWLKSATRETFEQAYENGDISKDEKNRFILKKNSKDVFQNYFKTLDLKQRAYLINQFVPDITIVIHYNVDETNNNWTSPTQKNFNMAFIPGNIKAEYLNKVTNRFEFLRLAITDDLDKSLMLGKNLIESYKQVLKVPIAQKADTKYLREESFSTSEEGVYVRNLVLTRLIHGPMIYGETLFQDNINECKALNDCTVKVHNMLTSPRVVEVANSYFKAVLKYYRNDE